MFKPFLRICAISAFVPALSLATMAQITPAATAFAAGPTQYVSPTGVDSSACTQTQPCATIQHAVDIAAAGAKVKVEAGTYNQTVNITKPLTLTGAGASSTTIDGSNIDTGQGLGTGSTTHYYGVVSVQNNPGQGGAIRISGFRIYHAFATPLDASQLIFPTDVSIYGDTNTSDNISVTDVRLGPVQDTADYGGIGFFPFNDAAPVSFTNSVSTGNDEGALLEGGGIGGSVTVSGVNFEHMVKCAGACSGSSTVYPGLGIFLLSDEPGTATVTISDNRFHSYRGFGIAVDAGYSGGNCSGSNGPCTGNVNLTADANRFSLGACTTSQGCAAIDLDAQSGNALTALITNNKGTVASPDRGIVKEPDSGVYSVTKSNNHIMVI